MREQPVYQQKTIEKNWDEDRTPDRARRRSAAAGWSISAKTRVQRYIKIRTDAPSSASIRFAFSFESSFTSELDFSILYRVQNKNANKYKGVSRYESYVITAVERYRI